MIWNEIVLLIVLTRCKGRREGLYWSEVYVNDNYEEFDKKAQQTKKQNHQQNSFEINLEN